MFSQNWVHKLNENRLFNIRETQIIAEVNLRLRTSVFEDKK